MSSPTNPLADRSAPEHTETVAGGGPPAVSGPTSDVGKAAGRPADPVEASQDLAFLAPPEQPGELGQLGPYRVLALLGSGGMGVVFRAFDVNLQRLVALKVIRAERARDPASRQRFLREARATAAVRDEYVVQIYAVGEEGGVPFLAMELLEGESLEDYLQRRARLPLSAALGIGRQITLGLAAVHAQGLIHRDLKPANVWLERIDRSPAGQDSAPRGGAVRYRAKLLDFGLAREAEGTPLTRTGTVMGSVGYMSPEQARAKPLDARSDLFSLGCVLYRLCTGGLPFAGNTLTAQLTALAVDDPVPVRKVAPEVPPALAGLIHELLAKDPADRPASTAEVVQLLQAMQEKPLSSGVLPTPQTEEHRLADSPEQAEEPRVSPSEVQTAEQRSESSRTRRAPRRSGAKCPASRHGRPWRRWLWPAAGALGLVLALGVGYLFYSRLHTHPEDNGSPAPEIRLHPGQVAPDLLDPRRLSEQPRPWPGGQPQPQPGWGPRPPELVAILRGQPRSFRGGLFFSPDSRWLAVSSGDQGQLATCVWDLATGEERSPPPIAGNGTSLHLAFSSDSRWLAFSGADGTIHLWDLLAGRSGHKLAGHTGPLESLAFSTDSKLLASGSADQTIRLWEVETGKERGMLTGHTGSIRSLAFSPDGRFLVSGGQDSQFKAWDVGRTEELFSRREAGIVTHCRFDPDGQSVTLIAGDQVLRRKWGTWKDQVLAESKDGPMTYAFNWDRARLAVGYRQLAATVWEVRSGKHLQRFGPFEHSVLGVAFFGPGRLATWGGASPFQVWEISNARSLLKVPSDREDCFALSPEGRYLARLNADGTVNIFRLMPSPPP
jgi:serine/threonine protein kinase/WD40 repeat protein